MKNYIGLLALVLLLSSCYDNFRFGEEAGIIEEEQVSTETIEQNIETVYFSDVVMDSRNQPLAGATVAVYAADIRYAQTTGPDGKYQIAVPQDQLPSEGFISISITEEVHKPFNLTYAAPLAGGVSYDSEEEVLMLSPCPNCIKIGDKSSELFHLGDDLYGGPENSQFQKATDGLEVSYQIDGAEGFAAIKMSLEIKGLQSDLFSEGNNSSIEFYSNGGLVSETILKDESPEDGSYGTFQFVVDNSRPITSIKVITRNFGPVDSNYDDWEFTCMYLEGE